MCESSCLVRFLSVCVCSHTWRELLEVIEKLKEVGLTVGAKKTHWTRHSKMVDTSIEVEGLAVGSKVCLDGNARHAIAHSLAQAKCLGKMANRIGLIMVPEETSLEHRELDTVAGFSVELERVYDGETPQIIKTTAVVFSY